MSTDYITKRDSEKVITKQQVLTYYPNAFVSDKDAEDGLTQRTVDVDLGITENGQTTWLYFAAGVVCGAATFGRNHTDALDMLSGVTGVDFVSEHDDDFSYHDFPVDVKTATPIEEKDGWQVFQCGDYVYLYNKTNDLFYSHVERKAAEYNIDEMIAEAE